jgi:hypothetical protein
MSRRTGLPTDIVSSTVDFSDQDTVSIRPTRCIIEWPVGLTPENGTYACANNTFVATVPDNSYFGIQNFVLHLTHMYTDNS